MHRSVEQIEVFIWNKRVGALALDPNLGFYVFSYEKNFGKSGIELSPLHMPINADETPFIFTELPESTFKRLPAMIADALPDDFGNALIDYYMASKGIAKSEISSLDRLAYMGKRGMGALEFHPAHGPHMHTTSALEMNELVTEARQVLHGDLANDLNINTALRNIIAVGTSAGGARAKAVIAWNPKTREIRNGQIDIPAGFEHWLLKFDGMGIDNEFGTTKDYGRIEYAYYLMAKAAGINIADSNLLVENNRAHFMTKRFDRGAGNIKHHMQSLCAMNHLDYKKRGTNSYEQLFLTIKELKLDYNDLAEAYRRMVFNVIARNCDDHTKNFAFLLRQGQPWELAPAYDITFAHNPKGEWTHQHLMSANGKFKDITYNDLLAVADRFQVGEAKQIIKRVQEVIHDWPSFADLAGISQESVRKISQEHLVL